MINRSERNEAKKAAARRYAGEEFNKADKLWENEVKRVFGHTNNARYEPRGRGEPGTELRRLYDAREIAMKAYHDAWK